MKAVSIVSIVYGSFGILWAAVVTVVIKIQSAMFSNFPWPEEVYEFIDFPSFLETIYSVIGTIFPFSYPTVVQQRYCGALKGIANCLSTNA